MKYFVILVLILGSTLVVAQPINFIEREIKFKIDSNNKYIDYEEIKVDKKDNIGNELQEVNSKVSNKNSGATESEVHAAINPIDNNNIIVSPILSDMTGGFPVLHCTVYYTKDKGITWNKSNFTTSPVGYPNVFSLGGGDPILVFDNNGKAYLSWLVVFQNTSGVFHGGLFWAYSEDGGETWETVDKPEILVIKNSNPQSSLSIPDKQWMSTTQDNDIITVFTQVNQSQQSQSSKINMSVKKANEVNFGEPIEVSESDNFDIVQFATSTVDTDNNVHVLYTGFKDDQLALYHRMTSDLGATFSENKKVTDFNLPRSIFNQTGSTDTIPGITVRRLYPAPMIVSDNSKSSPYSNNLYITWTANGITENSGKKMDVYFSRSTDGGLSWEPPRVLNIDLGADYVSNYYSSMTVNSEGVLSVTYYDRSNDPGNDLQTNYVLQTSHDGGVTFSQPTTVSTKFSDFSRIGLRNNGFGVGEYNMLLGNDDEVMPVWADGRENDGDVSIYFANVGLKETNVEIVNKITSENKIVDAIISNDGIVTIDKNVQTPSNYSYTVMSISGSTLFKTKDKTASMGRSSDLVDLSNLNTGVYFIKLNSDNSSSVAKVIVQ